MEKLSKSEYKIYNRIQYVIMPNHIHLMIEMHRDGRNGCPMGIPTLAGVVNQMKGYISKQIGHTIWQFRYHDPIIRNEPYPPTCALMSTETTMKTTPFTTLHLPSPPEIFAQGVLCTALGRAVTPAHQQVLLPEGQGVLLLAVQQGTAFGLIEEQAVQVGTGDLCLLPAHHHATLTAQDQPCQWIWVRLEGTQVTSIVQDMLSHGMAVFAQGESCVQRAMGGVFETCQKQQRLPATEICAQAYHLLTLLYGKNVQAQATQYPPLVVAAVQYMQQEFAHIYGVEDVARALEVSKEHLIRQFSAHMGQTAGKYLTALRIAHAKRLLASEDMPMELLAAASGFSSASYFSKVFRAETGMTPVAYRKSCAPNLAPVEIYL